MAKTFTRPLESLSLVRRYARCGPRCAGHWFRISLEIRYDRVYEPYAHRAAGLGALDQSLDVLPPQHGLDLERHRPAWVFDTTGRAGAGPRSRARREKAGGAELCAYLSLAHAKVDPVPGPGTIVAEAAATSATDAISAAPTTRANAGDSRDQNRRFQLGDQDPGLSRIAPRFIR